MPTLPAFDAAAKEQFATRGWVLAPEPIPAALLERWRALTDRLEAEALAVHAAGDQFPDTCIANTPAGAKVFRMDTLLRHDADAVLDLLACPALMAVARDLSGPGTVPLVVDVVYKQQHPAPGIIWHQGAPHDRLYPYLNVGVYLDDADLGDGCLRYIPGTQFALQDIAGLSKTHGWNIPDFVEQPAKAGQVLVQDMMILHGSQPKRSPGARRTLYIEYRPADGILAQKAQSFAWAHRRKRWMAHVLDRAAPGSWPADWPPHLDASAKGTVADMVRDVLDHPEPNIPSVYATLPVEGPDYPVPADLRA